MPSPTPRPHLLIAGSLLLITHLCNAQASAPGGVGLWDAHHFLWFTGHWSMSANKRTFIIDKGKPSGTGGTPSPTGGTPSPTGGGATPGTTPGAPPGDTGAGDPGGGDNNPPSGGTITVNPDGSVSLTNSSTDSWNNKMDKALQSAQQYLQQLNDPGDNLDPTTHHLYLALQPDAQQQVQQVQDLKINKNQDMLGGDNKTPAPTRTVADAVADGCKTIRGDYDMVMNYYKNHVKGHSNDLNVPAPPTMEYDCYTCDSNLRNNYDTTISHYLRDFIHPEDTIIAKGRSILRDFALVGVEAGQGMSSDMGDLFVKNKKDPSKSGACSYIDIDGLSEAIRATVEHLYLRAAKLVQTNKTNYKAAEPVIRAYMICAREWGLTSGRDETDNMYPVFQDMISRIIDHYVGEFQHNDWRQIGNIPYIFSMMREYQLFGGADAGFDNFLNRMLKVINGFKMTVEMDIKMGQDAAYKLVHLKGDCHIIPSFQQDSNQCYKWVVADENFQDILGFYKEKGLQTLDCNLLANQVVSPPQVPRITYTGTKKYSTRLMSLSMDFCNPGHDSIVLTGFAPNPAQAGTWLYPGNFVSNEGVNGMEQYFEDIKAKKKLVDDGAAQQAQNDLKNQAEKLKVQMEALKAQMGSAQSGAQAGANYEKLMEFQKNMMGQLSTPTIAKMLWLDFLLPVQNNDPVLVDKKFDAREINPDEKKAIIYGYYTIHIENDGNGKPKPKTSGSPAAPKK